MEINAKAGPCGCEVCKMCPDGSAPANTDMERGDHTCAELAAAAQFLTPDHETCGEIQASAVPCGCPEMCTPVADSAEPWFGLNAAHFTATASVLMLAECSAMLHQAVRGRL